MVRKRKYPDLPPRSDPDYMRKFREKTKLHRREYERCRRKKHPEKFLYDPVRAKNYREKNRVALKEKAWRRWGIIDFTYDRYQRELKTQKGKCKICEKRMIKPQVDHCHLTGKYRALLCALCNNQLGVYEKHRDRFEMYLDNF